VAYCDFKNNLSKTIFTLILYFFRFRMKLSVKLYAALVAIATKIVVSDEVDVVDDIKDFLSNATETIQDAVESATETLKDVYEFSQEYGECWDGIYSLYDDNEDLLDAYVAYNESLRVDKLSSTTSESKNTSISYSFSAEELSTYEKECKKIEGNIWYTLPEATLLCKYDGGEDVTNVLNYGECYPDTEECNSLDVTSDAFHEGLLRILWDAGYKCTFDDSADLSSASDTFDDSADLSSASKNPYDDMSSSSTITMKLLSLAITTVVGVLFLN